MTTDVFRRTSKPAWIGDGRRHFPNLLFDPGRLRVKGIFAGGGIIGHHAKGKDIALETVRVVAVPFLRRHILGRAHGVLLFVRDEGRQIAGEIGM